ncbi:MAG: hypothetical protein RIR20_1411, partial [Pseudomonadota bacterium]
MTVTLEKNILKSYFLATYLVILYLVSDSIPMTTIFQEGLLPFGFMIVSFLLYSLYYLLPSLVITSLVQFISKKFSPESTKATYIAAIVSTGLTTLLLYANAKIFALYGMFFNGFILNLI